MSFKSKLIENVINPYNSQNASNSMGKVLSYNPILNQANVLVSSSGVFNTLENVPVQLSGKGLMSSQIQTDDLVYIQYNNGSVFQPKIVGIADEDYENNTRERSKHMRKGSLLRNIIEKDGILKSRSARRIDNDSDCFKHCDYKEVDATEAIMAKEDNLGRFSGQEVGMFHPIYSSLVKLKDNGDIDIFTGTNTGIRISRKNKTIDMFGDTYTNATNWKVLSNNVTVVSNTIDIECKDLKLKADNLYVNEEKLDV